MLWTFYVVLAITLGSIEIVFNLVGAISSNMIGCILPTLFYIRLTENNPRSKGQFYFVKGFYYTSYVLTVVCITSELLKIIAE